MATEGNNVNLLNVLHLAGIPTILSAKKYVSSFAHYFVCKNLAAYFLSSCKLCLNRKLLVPAKQKKAQFQQLKLRRLRFFKTLALDIAIANNGGFLHCSVTAAAA